MGARRETEDEAGLLPMGMGRYMYQSRGARTDRTVAAGWGEGVVATPTVGLGLIVR
jgi:hypothetical protein